MALSAMMGLLDDAARPIMRLFGRNVSSKAPKKTFYEAFNTRFGKMTGMNALAQREQRLKGAGLSGAVFGRPVKGLGVGLSHLKGIGYFATGAGILESALAPRGHKMSGFAGGVGRTAGFAVGDIIGNTIAGPIGGFVLGSLTEKVGGAVGDAVQMFNDFNRTIKHINMGGNYEDSRVAYTMRQRAAQEMGTSVMNARAWLGKEAVLMHQ